MQNGIRADGRSISAHNATHVCDALASPPQAQLSLGLLLVAVHSHIDLRRLLSIPEYHPPLLIMSHR